MRIRLKKLEEFLKSCPEDYNPDKKLIMHMLKGNLEFENSTPFEGVNIITIDDCRFTIPDGSYEIIPEPFNKGQKVLVWMGDDDIKQRRYYSHFENGFHYCFYEGRTEWSSNSAEIPNRDKICEWCHCEAWEEE